MAIGDLFKSKLFKSKKEREHDEMKKRRKAFQCAWRVWKSSHAKLVLVKFEVPGPTEGGQSDAV